MASLSPWLNLGLGLVRSCLNYSTLESLFNPCSLPPTAHLSPSPVILPLSDRLSPPCVSFSLQLPFDHTSIISFLLMIYLPKFPAWSDALVLFSLLGIFFHHISPNSEVKLSPTLSLRLPFPAKSSVAHTRLQEGPITPSLVFLLYSLHHPVLPVLESIALSPSEISDLLENMGHDFLIFLSSTLLGKRY